MFNYHLVALPQGGTEPVFWASSSREQMLDAWTRLCLLGVERAVSAAKELSAPLDLFLCACGDEIRDRQDEAALAALLERCSDHGWGSRRFLVAVRDENHLSLDILAFEPRPALEGWLKTAWTGGATDLLQVSYDPYGLIPPQGPDLHRAVKWAEHRHELLLKLQSAHYSDERPWRCRFLLSESWRNETQKSTVALLGPWMQHPAPDRDDGANLVLVVRGHADQTERLKAEMRRYANRHFLVATLHSGDLSILQSDCQHLGLAPPMFFAGVLELWYFLLLLNRNQSPERAPAFGQLVTLERPAVFSFEHSSPEILITSSFMPAEPGQCLQASIDVGQFLARAPRELRPRIEPAIDLSRLKEVLEEMPEVKIWIHLGHGKANQGLCETGKNQPCPPEEWLGCFSERRRRPPLAAVMFLTCHSAEAAQIFARAGVSMAVGFEGEVGSDLTRKLAIEILAAAFEEGLRPAALLRGFRAGQERLRHQWMDCVPRAYYPRAI